MDKAKILIVEDEGIVAKDIQKCLQTLGYLVSAIVDTGEEAVKQATLLRPDLILMDIVLKGDMDGIEAARHIRNHIHVPVIYLTAYSDKNILKRAMITEPYGYIIKPYSERELRSAIEMALYKFTMEDNLRKNYNLLHTILKSIGKAVIATDSHTNIIFINKTAQELTGWTESEAFGKPLSQVLSLSNQKAQAFNPAHEVIENPRNTDFNHHTILTARDRMHYAVTGSCAPVFDDESHIIGTVVIFYEITCLSTVEKDLIRAHTCESVGAFVDFVACDCNEVSTRIIENIKLAKTAAQADNNKLISQLTEIEKACSHVIDMADNLSALSMSKNLPKKEEVTHLSELIKDTVSLIVHRVSIKCEIFLPENLWAVKIDREMMQQVFSHLLVNAVESMSEDGRGIEIKAKNETLTHDDVPFLKKGCYVKVQIRDRGCGIPQSNLNKIFDPFFTTKHKKSGLGLTIAYATIKKHNGALSIESEVDRGTTVSLYVPASDT
jgi:two-component system cell cycle sensor histidine kinase/response regulator CckA